MNNWIIDEMDIVRECCSLIHKQREQAGFKSLKYPIVQVKINRYFLPEFRDIIADECNVVGYMSIPPVEYWEKETPYEKSGTLKVWIDTTRSTWQDELYEERVALRNEAEKRKQEQS